MIHSVEIEDVVEFANLLLRTQSLHLIDILLGEPLLLLLGFGPLPLRQLHQVDILVITVQVPLPSHLLTSTESPWVLPILEGVADDCSEHCHRFGR